MLKLKIVSPEKVEFSGEVTSVKVPGTTGSFEILAKEDDYCTISEEYAKTGLYALEEDYAEYPTKLFNKLEMEALRFFDSKIDEE